MSKPQWKIDLENKERAIKEREEAEKQAKAAKLASLSSGQEPTAPVKSVNPEPEVLPQLGLVDESTAIDLESKRLDRHLQASESKSQPAKSPQQIAAEKAEEERLLDEQRRSDELALKMQRRMAEYQAKKAAQPSTGSSLIIETVEEDDYAKQKAAANIASLINKLQ